MNILQEYKNIEENTDTLISIIFIDRNYNEVIKIIQENLNKANNITNIIKKNKINNRYYSLLNFIQQNYNEESIINNIFLIHDKLIHYKLNENEMNVAKTYNLQKIFIKCDTFFYIDYIIDIFYNLNFIYIIKIIKNNLHISKINKNKEKDLENHKINNEQKICEEIENIRKNYNYKDYIILCGNSLLLNKIDKNIKNIIIEKDKENYNRVELFNIYELENIKNNNILLEKRLTELQNPNTNLDLYVFGKLKIEIKEAIEMYILKELYIEDKKLERLKKIVDNNYLNFKIIEIKSINNNDVAYNFIKDYNGIMGIKYY
jgi:hypothetical protein